MTFPSSNICHVPHWNFLITSTWNTLSVVYRFTEVLLGFFGRGSGISFVSFYIKSDYGSPKIILHWLHWLQPINIALIHSGQLPKTQLSLQQRVRTLSACSESAEMLAAFQVVRKKIGSCRENKLQRARQESPLGNGIHFSHANSNN